MPVVPFFKLFKILPNGNIVPKLPIQIGAKVLFPGISIPPGYLVAGIDIAFHIGDDLEVELKDDRYILKRFVAKEKSANP